MKDFRFHGLRHSAASYLAMNGVSLGEIAEVLGPKTLTMVKRYARLSAQHTVRVVERMNTAICGKVADWQQMSQECPTGPSMKNNTFYSRMLYNAGGYCRYS